MALSAEDRYKILVDTVNGKPQRIKGAEADAFREALEKDIADIKRRGGQVEIPQEWEVDTDASVPTSNLRWCPMEGGQ